MANRNVRRQIAIYRSRMVDEINTGLRSKWPVYKQKSVHKHSPQPRGVGPTLMEQSVMFGSVKEHYPGHKQKLINNYAV